MKRYIIPILLLCSGALGAVVNVSPQSNLSNAITQAGVGGTIQCAPGTYPVTIRLNLLSKQTITGAGAVFKGAANDVFGVYNAQDVTIDGVTIDGGWCGIIGTNTTRLKVRNTTFQNQGNGGVACGVWLLMPLDCDISHNTFRNVGFHGSEARCLFTQDSKGTHFDFNDVGDCVSGVHAYWFGDNRQNIHNCTFNYNNIHGMMYWHGLEIQYAPNTVEVKGNFIGNLGAGTFGMALSIATGGDPNKKRPSGSVMGPFDNPPNSAYNILIDGNVIDMSGKGNTAANWSQYAGTETMGDTVRITNNFVKNAGQAILYGLNTGNLNVSSNTFVGCPANFSGEYEHHDPFTQANNTVLASAPTPPPPTTQSTTQPVISNVKAVANNDAVTITWDGGPATLNRYDKWGDVESGSAYVPAVRSSGYVDKAFRPDQLGTGNNDGWEFYYTANGAKSNVVQVSKPATQPVNPTTQPDYDIIIRMHNGLPVNAPPTTRKAA